MGMGKASIIIFIIAENENMKMTQNLLHPIHNAHQSQTYRPTHYPRHDKYIKSICELRHILLNNAGQ